jgi:hypothetical protein
MVTFSVVKITYGVEFRKKINIAQPKPDQQL